MRIRIRGRYLPFHDRNGQLLHIKGSKTAFLRICEKDYMNLNVKIDS